MEADAAPEAKEIVGDGMSEDSLSADDLAELEAQKLIQASQTEDGSSFDEGFEEKDEEVVALDDESLEESEA
jgi:hypothetical protein